MNAPDPDDVKPAAGWPSDPDPAGGPHRGAGGGVPPRRRWTPPPAPAGFVRVDTDRDRGPQRPRRTRFRVRPFVGLAGGVLFALGLLTFGCGADLAAVDAASAELERTDDGALTARSLLALTRPADPAAAAAVAAVLDDFRPAYVGPLHELDHIVGLRGAEGEALRVKMAVAAGVDPDLSADERRRATQRGVWGRVFAPLPGYVDFKSRLYRRIDPRFAAYFGGLDAGRVGDPASAADRASFIYPRAKIRLDEVVWGGVQRDGIPPLKDPDVVPADHADAAYLGDGDVVFGVAVNGEARAYPKRILAWHEMVKDQLGGVSINGVYCTLCGSMIVYDTRAAGPDGGPEQHYELGTSGFLYRSNKLMYDHATESMWSTITGEPVLGELVGRGVKLNPRTVVTTTWGDWRRRHPDTTVPTLATGHERDYGEGVAYRAYFGTDRLMFPVPTPPAAGASPTDLANKAPVLALRFGGTDARPVTPHAITSRFLAARPVYAATHGGQDFVVLTDGPESHRVYDPDGVVFAGFDGEKAVTDDAGGAWTLTEDALVADDGRTRPRLPSHNAFWFGWQAAHPDTGLTDAE